MKSLLMTVSFLSVTAQAHIEVGEWQGITKDGQPCVMTVGTAYFENNLPHPLNERIPVTNAGKTIVVHHPSKMDVATATVTFNHDLFQGILATTTGARAIEIEMVHTPQFEGPKAFTLMEDFWQARRQVSYRCDNLKHVATRPGYRP